MLSRPGVALRNICVCALNHQCHHQFISYGIPFYLQVPRLYDIPFTPPPPPPPQVPALQEMEWDVAAVSQTTTGLNVMESKVTLEVRQDRVRVAGGREGDITYFAPGGRGANMLKSYGGYLRYSVLPVVENNGENWAMCGWFGNVVWWNFLMWDFSVGESFG